MFFFNLKILAQVKQSDLFYFLSIMFLLNDPESIIGFTVFAAFNFCLTYVHKKSLAQFIQNLLTNKAKYTFL